MKGGTHGGLVLLCPMSEAPVEGGDAPPQNEAAPATAVAEVIMNPPTPATVPVSRAERALRVVGIDSMCRSVRQADLHAPRGQANAPADTAAPSGASEPELWCAPPAALGWNLALMGPDPRRPLLSVGGGPCLCPAGPGNGGPTSSGWMIRRTAPSQVVQGPRWLGAGPVPGGPASGVVCGQAAPP